MLGLHCCVDFSLFAASEASLAVHRLLNCGGISCCGEQVLWDMGFSGCDSWALEHRLNNRGARA